MMRNKQQTQLNGILLVDKKSGITSFDVIRKITKTLGFKKIGHCGTLDPLATGLLILCIGKSTKLASFFEGLDKKYHAKIKLGQTTDTYDSEGSITKSSDVNVSKDELYDVIKSFSGRISQMPPSYSAIKTAGVPAYKLAREGKKVNLKAREVTIHHAKLTSWSLPYFEIEVSCSKGTYIRSLAHDIGEKLGCGGHITSLRRLSIGNFSSNEAIGCEAAEDKILSSIVSPLDALYFFKEILVKKGFEQSIINGKKLNEAFFISNDIINLDYGMFKAVSADNKLLALLDKRRDNTISYIKVFSSENL